MYQGCEARSLGISTTVVAPPSPPATPTGKLSAEKRRREIWAGAPGATSTVVLPGFSCTCLALDWPPTSVAHSTPAGACGTSPPGSTEELIGGPSAGPCL